MKIDMYLSWKEKTLSKFDDAAIDSAYNDGFVFTRVGKRTMNQTRSLRINLKKFNLSSENKRILKKTEDVDLNVETIPYQKYDWSIHKMGKDFYAKKFGDKTFSAQKIKELIANKDETGFNRLFIYNLESSPIGYCICSETKNILHYCYPFYQLQITHYKLPNLGMGMMLKAIAWAKERGKKYIYLGSAQRPGDIYKLQFNGLEWFDGKIWKNNLDELKNIIKQ